MELDQAGFWLPVPFIDHQNQYQRLSECLFLKNAGNTLLEELSGCLSDIQALFNTAKSTSHNLHYVRFTVLRHKTDSDEYKEVKNLSQLVFTSPLLSQKCKQGR
jgi:hypothetical protein